MNELYSQLIPWVRGLAGGVLTIRANQNAERPEGVPYITLLLSSRTYSAPSYVVGVDEAGNSIEVDLFDFVAEINVYGLNEYPAQAGEIMGLIIQNLRNHTENVRVLGRSTVLKGILAGPIDVTQQVGEQYQPRFNVELSMMHSAQISQNSGTIETVETSGSFENMGTGG